MTGSDEPAWHLLLNPSAARPRLVAASVFIALFECIKDVAVDRVRSFYCPGEEPKQANADPRYRSEVLSRKKHAPDASLDWFVENGALESHDVDQFHRLRGLRNELAHELLDKLVNGTLPEDFSEQTAALIGLLRKIEMWWILEVQVPSNPAYDGRDITEGDVASGLVATAELLEDIVVTSSSDERELKEQLRKRFTN